MIRGRWALWLHWLLRIVLSLVFLASAWPKIVDPPAFAKALDAYQLLPAWAIHPMALVMPWMEALCGLAILSQPFVAAAAQWMLVLLASFVCALSINLARHHPVDCGCFRLDPAPQSTEERLADMKGVIARDLLLILVSAHVLAFAITKPKALARVIARGIARESEREGGGGGGDLRE